MTDFGNISVAIAMSGCLVWACGSDSGGGSGGAGGTGGTGTDGGGSGGAAGASGQGGGGTAGAAGSSGFRAPPIAPRTARRSTARTRRSIRTRTEPARCTPGTSRRCRPPMPRTLLRWSCRRPRSRRSHRDRGRGGGVHSGARGRQLRRHLRFASRVRSSSRSARGRIAVRRGRAMCEWFLRDRRWRRVRTVRDSWRRRRFLRGRDAELPGWAAVLGQRRLLRARRHRRRLLPRSALQDAAGLSRGAGDLRAGRQARSRVRTNAGQLRLLFGLRVPAATDQCAAILVATSVGDSCGFDSSTGFSTRCSGEMFCSSNDFSIGLCNPRPTAGQACDVNNDRCKSPSRCVTGTCTLPADVTCG